MDQREMINSAKKKVRDKREFYKHFSVYCAVVTLLLVANFVLTSGSWWFLLAIAGWTMALIGHYLNVFGIPSIRSQAWEEAQFEKEMNKLERQRFLKPESDDRLDLKEGKLELRERLELEQKYNTDDLV